MPWNEEEARNFNDDEGDEADDEWHEDDGEVATIPCPQCGHEVYEEAQFCPRCESYLSEEENPSPGKPWWMILGALLAMGGALTWILG